MSIKVSDNKHQRKLGLVAASIFVLIAVTPSSTFGQQHPVLVSVNSANTGSGDKRSGDFGRQRITSDGRFVLFYSEATNVGPVPGPSQPSDIFVRDLSTGATMLVSTNLSGGRTSGVESNALISDNGRYVAFTSFANDVVSNDTNTSPDVFLRDMQLGTSRLVSINAAGTASGALGGSQLLDMTPDGRFIVFSSDARDLTSTPDGNTSASDIYIRDMVNNVTMVVSMNVVGTASGNGLSFGGSVSADGRYVVFTSQASDLVAGDTSTRDVFLRDLQTQTTTRVSTNAAGTAGGNAESSGGVIDIGGHFVVFSTQATDLSNLPDTNQLADIFIYDLQTGSRRLITSNVAGTATGNALEDGFFNHGVAFVISRDARFVSFASQSGDLVTNDTNGNNDDIFLYDVATQTKSLVSVNPAGNSGTVGMSFKPSISADGHFVAFESLTNDLVSTPDETGGFTTDVFVRDVVAGKTYLVSLNSAGTRTGNSFSFEPVISADGSRLVFFSRASDLITNDLNGFNEDVFYFDVPSSPSNLSTNIQFSQSAYQINENGLGASVTVTRTGFVSGENSVSYMTADAANGNCSTIGGQASLRCDYEASFGIVNFASGETSKTIYIPVVDDAYAEGDETFTISLGNPTNASLGTPANATITILDNDSVNGPNPIDQTSFFVRQHYIDFLNREADAAGLAFWSNQITECQQPGATCSAAVRRINVSAAFFLSIEFQETGYLVERLYKVAYGDANGVSTLGGNHQLTVPTIRFDEFLPDSQRVGKGLVVGQPGWEQVLENNKVAFTQAFVARSRFGTSYSALLTPPQFVDKLFANAGFIPTTAERNAAINEFGGAAAADNQPARARALRRVAENPTLNSNEKNRAFVLMQYFGYLRRNPNDPQDTDYSGYDFWLTKLNEFNGNFVNADMVQAFIDSGEYRGRFGP